LKSANSICSLADHSGRVGIEAGKEPILLVPVVCNAAERFHCVVFPLLALGAFEGAAENLVGSINVDLWIGCIVTEAKALTLVPSMTASNSLYVFTTPSVSAIAAM
jgi:hypothetical protein